MSVNILGYSERGMINALCADLQRERSLEAVQQLLKTFAFPFATTDCPGTRLPCRVQILVEQSFSEFGDPDVTFLLDYDSKPYRQLLFVEAKVHTSTGSSSTTEKRWNKFKAAAEMHDSGGSNLFMQMYRRQRLLELLRSHQWELPDRFRPAPWKLGENPIVEHAVKLCQPYAEDGWVAALLPEPRCEVEACFGDCLRNTHHLASLLDGWNSHCWGLTTWECVNDLCRRDSRWKATVAAFKYNGRQIYRRWQDVAALADSEEP